MYPERYCIDQFPDDQEWKKLQIEQQKVAPEFLEVVLNPAFQNDCGTLRQQSPASRTAPPLPQPGNWTLAIMVGIIALPVVLVTTLFVLFYLAVWVPVRAAQNVPRQGPLFPQVVQPQLGLPQEAQVFAEDEWQPMEEPFSLPMVEGAVPAVDAQTPASERVELVSPDARGSQQFMDRSVTGEPLVGLRIIQGDNWGGAVQALQPIYLGKDCYFLGTWCGAPGGKQQAQSIAKPSYAVGAVELRRGLVVNAIRIEYWRIADGKLDPADKYVTDWYGCKGGSKLPPMSSEGRSVIGIAGKFHEDLYELQIICSNEK